MIKLNTSVEKLRREVKELEVINCELTSLKPSAKVYKQHGSGQVFFLANKVSVTSEYKGALNEAKQKLEKAEKTFTQ